MKHVAQQLRSWALLTIGQRFSRTNVCSLAKLPSTICDVRDQRLAKLLDHARDNVPFYKSRVKPSDKLQKTPMERLARFPMLSKNDVEQNFPDRMTDDSDPADWRMISTRGTAQRLVTIQDFLKRDANRAAQLRTLRMSGGYRLGKPKVEIPPELCEVVCGDKGEREQSVSQHLVEIFKNRQLLEKKSWRNLRGSIERQWIYNSKIYPGFGHHGTKPPTEVLQAYVDRLRKDQPYVVKTLATYLVELAKHLRNTQQLPLQIPVVKAMGSRVTPKQRTIIEHWFGGTFWDDYGSAEFGSIACECDQHDGLHVFEDMFVVEVVNAAGQPVPNGELGWILVTDLLNRAMPLIRYKIGDVGIRNTDACLCGRSSARLTVTGRAHDVLVTDAGSWRTHDDVVDFCESFSGVDSCVVEHRGSNRYSLTVVPDANEMFQREAFADAFVSWIGSSATATVSTATTIPAEAGGKFRFVKGNLVQPRSVA